MVAGTGSSSWGPVLKTLFPRNKRLEIVERLDPFLGVIAKPDDFEGDYVKIPVQTLLTQSVGSTIAYAESNAQDSEFGAFLLTRKKYYSSNQFERELMEASRSDKGAFLKGMQKVIKDGNNILSRELVRQCYGNTAGARGVVSSISTTDIVLSDPMDGIWFKEGMILQLADASTPTTARTGTVTIASVAMSSTSCTIACTANVTAGISAAAATDIIYRYGDISACIDGLRGWIPVTAPGGVSYYGVTRTAEPELIGHRYTSTATNVMDALLDGLSEFGFLGADDIDYGLMNYKRFMELAKEAESTVTRTEVKTKETGFGWKALSISGPKGEVKLLPSWAQDYDHVDFITSDTWKLHTLGGSAPMVIKDPLDGKYIHRVSGYDRYKIEQGWYANMGCESPKDNGLLILG